MFQLKEPTTVKLMNISTHLVKRGKKDFRDAYSLHFEIEGANHDVLALLHPKLCEAMYYDADGENGQETAPSIAKILPDLRFPKLAQVPWPEETTGMDLCLVYGLGDDKSNIELDDGKVTTKTVVLKARGTSLLYFSFWTESMPDGVLDKLRGKQRQEVSITLVQPERLRADAVIDGAVGHPGAAEAQRRAEEEAGQQRLDDDGAPPAKVGKAENGKDWPFGTEGDPDEDGSEGGEPDATEVFVEQHAGKKSRRKRETA